MIFHPATQPGAKHKRKRMPILTLPFLAPPGASKFPLVYVGDDALFDNLKQPLHMRMGRKCNLPNNAPRYRCQCLDGQCRKFAQQLPQKKKQIFPTAMLLGNVTWHLPDKRKEKLKRPNTLLRRINIPPPLPTKCCEFFRHFTALIFHRSPMRCLGFFGHTTFLEATW